MTPACRNCLPNNGVAAWPRQRMFDVSDPLWYDTLAVSRNILTWGQPLRLPPENKTTEALYMKRISTRRLAQGAMIAALYAALSLAVAPLSFGPIQLRFAEALTILPVFTPVAIPGLTLGCVITNAMGLAMGANVAGALDILFGSLATLIAAILTRKCRGIRWGKAPVLATLPPVLVNALVLGIELPLATMGELRTATFFLFAGEIALGQLAACCGLGLFLWFALQKTKADQRLFV